MYAFVQPLSLMDDGERCAAVDGSSAVTFALIMIEIWTFIRYHIHAYMINAHMLMDITAVVTDTVS